MTVDGDYFSRIGEITFQGKIAHQCSANRIFTTGQPFHRHFTTGKQIGIDTRRVRFHITVESSGRNIHLSGREIDLIHISEVECPFIKRVSVQCCIKSAFRERKFRSFRSKWRDIQAERHDLARSYRITSSIYFHIRIKRQYKMICAHSVFISPVHQVGVDKLHHFRRRVYVFSTGFSSLRIFGVIVTASGQHPHRRNSEQADTQ